MSSLQEKKKKRIKGYDYRKCHPKLDKRVHWRMAALSKWAIIFRFSNGKKESWKKKNPSNVSDPELCSVIFVVRIWLYATKPCHTSIRKRKIRTRGTCLPVCIWQEKGNRGSVQWGCLMSASRLCPVEEAQQAQRPNTDVSFQPQSITVTCHE